MIEGVVGILLSFNFKAVRSYEGPVLECEFTHFANACIILSFVNSFFNLHDAIVIAVLVNYKSVCMTMVIYEYLI